MNETYEYWQAKLDGGDPDPLEPRTDLPLGFWRMRDSRPLAVWMEAGTRQALIGFNGSGRMMRQGEMERIAEMGGFGNAVTEAHYRAAFLAGFWEHDEPPPTGIRDIGPGHNLPEDPFELLTAELADETMLAEGFLAKPIASQADADKAGTWARRIGVILKTADEAFAEEKRPHLEAGKRVDDKWRGIRTDARSLVDRLKDHVGDWLRRQKREAQEKARQAALEAERLRREAAEKQAIEDKARLVEQAQKLDKVAEAEARPLAGRPNMRVGLRTERRAKIVDYDAALQALKDHPDMRALVLQLAQRAVKAGLPIAGVEVEEVEVVR